MFIEKRKAFTLAEVLVTLAVIGVVAALTIPSLMTNMQNAGTASKVKKATSVLNQAIKMYSVDNGCFGDLATCGDYTGSLNAAGNQQIWNALKPYFKVVRDCGTAAGEACFAKGVTYKFLNGEDSAIFDDHDGAKSILADGASILVTSFIGNCSVNASRTGSSPLKYVCGAIFIDINGSKGPNQIGKDFFRWSVAKAGIVYPAGALDDFNFTAADGTPFCDATASTNAKYGWGCAGKIMREGKINY